MNIFPASTPMLENKRLTIRPVQTVSPSQILQTQSSTPTLLMGLVVAGLAGGAGYIVWRTLKR